MSGIDYFGFSKVGDLFEKDGDLEAYTFKTMILDIIRQFREKGKNGELSSPEYVKLIQMKDLNELESWLKTLADNFIEV